MNHHYHFVTVWKVRGRREDVFDILLDPLEYPRWWPSVYLSAEEVTPQGKDGTGQRTQLHTKGWLPYTLRWEALTTEVERPRSISIRAFGDFDGRGTWTLQQEGDLVRVQFDWRLAAEKPLLKYLSFAFKPLFSANHRWAMEQGRQALEREIARGVKERALNQVTGKASA